MPNFDDDVLVDGLRGSMRNSSRSDATKVVTRDPPIVARLMLLQRTVGNAGVAQLMGADDDRASVERATARGGAPLETGTRVQMEQALGSDLSSVRVHTGGEADASAKQLGAHAYTVGDDVVFANGRYDPGSTTGQRTLAHELAHVVQQRSGPVDGTDTGGGVKVSDPGDRFEQEAEATAEQVVSRKALEISLSPGAAGGGAAVQRDADEVRALALQRNGETDEEPEEVQREGDTDEEPDEVQPLSAQRDLGTEDEEAVE